ncbi:MAG: DNA polymerase beta domain-containing protein [Candidatus Magnetoglobus multicellularis str. Araruama]|uniref:DNA polymerase beta domain-containing protein n=1 Tax=Candidatus Magnetoglobus multicellularis str. Araruama TaxID=890399 RepID=A0A1V1P0I4_9BACT|nr:MAG: DNA polymerase beta domain-containing protein [Candidatus Magnetoglobus multicellularis str. Araruama]
MDQRKIINIAKLYSDTVRGSFNALISQIILFGSYAKNNAKVDSDIDIAIVVENFDDDYLSTITQLNKLTRNIDDRIEPLLFLKDNDKSGFLGQIQTEGKILYSNA